MGLDIGNRGINISAFITWFCQLFLSDIAFEVSIPACTKFQR